MKIHSFQYVRTYLNFLENFLSFIFLVNKEMTMNDMNVNVGVHRRLFLQQIINVNIFVIVPKTMNTKAITAKAFLPSVSIIAKKKKIF